MKSDSPGMVTLIGGADWQICVGVSPTDGCWQRIWKTFIAGAKDCDFIFRINTGSPTSGVWIDDVKLEEGSIPTFDAPDVGKDAKPFFSVDESAVVVQRDGSSTLAFVLSSPRAVAGTLNVAVQHGRIPSQPITLDAGVWRVLVKGKATLVHDVPRTATLRLEDAGKEVVRFETPCSSTRLPMSSGVWRR